MSDLLFSHFPSLTYVSPQYEDKCNTGLLCLCLFVATTQYSDSSVALKINVYFKLSRFYLHVYPNKGKLVLKCYQFC